MRLSCLVALLLLGCAPTLQAAPAPGPTGSTAMAAQMADMQKVMLEMQAAQENARRECEPQRARAPGWAEERAIGTSLAVSLVVQRGRFYLDGLTETDPSKLEDELAQRKLIVLPEGKKTAVSAHVAVVGKHLARYSARPGLPWVFGVIENDTAETFSAPGGFVFITTGLLKKLSNEAQLAGVLGHEMSHVVKKDLLGKYVEAKYSQCVTAKVAALMLQRGAAGPNRDAARFAKAFDDFDLDKSDGSFKAFLFDAMLLTMMMGSDKAAEFEHDQAALELVSFAGYDALEYEKFLATNPMPKHPEAAERAKKLQTLREGELKDIAVGTLKPDLSKLFAPLAP